MIGRDASASHDTNSNFAADYGGQRSVDQRKLRFLRRPDVRIERLKFYTIGMGGARPRWFKRLDFSDVIAVAYFSIMTEIPATSFGRLLMTGATGFVGRHLMPAAGSFKLRVALRSVRTPCFDSAESQVVGDIDGGTDWTRALAGIDYVVHLAARVHVMQAAPSDQEAFERVNVAGSERLAAAAAAAGVKRFIFLSSVKVNGDATSGRAFRADDPPRPFDAYGRSKLEAERRLSRIGAETGMSVAIIRPPLVYGPGVEANFLRLLSWAEHAYPLPLKSIRNMRSFVSVWNLCDLIVTLLSRREAVPGVFMVSDGRDLSTPELIHQLARAMGKTERLFPAPLWLLRTAAAATGRTAEFSRLCGSLTVDIAATCERLKWSPPLSLEEGLERTARWYLQASDRGRAAK
jgi:nucleoside-diphosphate-sugar epimerase